MDVEIQLIRLPEHLRPAVAALELEESQHGYVPPMDQVLARARQKQSVCEFAVLRDNLLVGYFQLNFSRRETAHYCPEWDDCGLEAMAVDRRLQGQGIGAAALRKLPSLMRRAFPDYRRVNLTVNMDNDPAIKAYGRAGFVDTGRFYHGARSGPQHIFSLLI